MRAIEDYAENETDVNTRWTYKADEGGMIHECDIATWFDTSTEVTLSIFISNCVVIVHVRHTENLLKLNSIRLEIDSYSWTPRNHLTLS